jgi:imidazoleglycerol-phosphate dehydratase
MSRSAEVRRQTAETDVRVLIDLDGSGRALVGTGVGFFDHMLTLLAAHSGVDLEVEARGDLATGSHHTVEDTGIVIGQALHKALGEREGITRYGSALMPMDECLAQAAIDVSGRPFLACDVALPATVVGGFETDLLSEFLRGLANHAGLTLHLRLLSGENPHHVIEACFKAVARALRVAVAIDPRQTGVPSTKGSL